MKSTKDKILQTLLRRPKITINELAESVGINPISVRHHLTNLQMEGLIAADEERHGVGRPRLVYSLTEDGMERFPTKYLRLTTRLLAQMKETMPAPMVSKLFNLNGKRRVDSIRSMRSPARIIRSVWHIPRSVRWTRR
jgi:predicted ArsR family transcriptional regulator